jgi:phage/plasmid primase-like uncharacterized protein
MSEDDRSRALEALHTIPPDWPRDEWHKVGRAAIAAGLTTDDLNEWSAPAHNYKGESDVRSAFRTVTKDGGTGPGTLFAIAREHGYTGRAVQRPSSPELASQRAERERAAAAQALADEQRHQEARQAAATLLEAAQLDPTQHAYWQRKRVKLGKHVRRGAWPQRGWDDALLIPAFDTNREVITVEAISASGRKDSLRYGRKSGAIVPVRQFSKASIVLIAEGVATVAAAVECVPGCGAVSSLGASNLPNAARIVRNVNPGATIVIIPDHDPSGTGLAAASKAAAEAGGVVVKLAGLLTDGKFDAWDVFDTLGDQALAQAIQQAVDASTAQKVFAIRASVPEVETTAELGICALGMLGEFLAFWRSDCKRVFLLRPSELGKHQGLQRLAPTQRWESWAGGDFKPQQASNALIQICTAIGSVDLNRVADAPSDAVNAAFMQARAVAMPSPVALAELLALDTRWRQAVFFDVFAGRAACSMPLPCGGAVGALLDEHDELTSAFLGSTLGISVTSKQAHDALNLLAKQHPRHLLQEYLNSLHWDGTPRLNRYLIDCAGSPDTRFVRAVSAKALIAAVARAFEPGAKVDTCLVLEGAQGVKKSSLIAALVPQRAWFAEDLAGALNNKDALQGLSGKWLVELSELAATRKSTIEEVKSFLTRRVDNYRAPYGRRVADHPRQCVFFGSVNPAADGSWLHDATGGRRFWPVYVARADVAKLEQMRDQLWAEAVHAYRQGQQYWLTDEEEAFAAQEQKARLQENPWDLEVSKFIESPQFTGTIATSEVYTLSQSRPPTSRDSGELRHIADALKARGWVSRQTGPERRARWHPPESPVF